ncbi:MAG: hypothetical protein U0Q08_06285 [Dermatophilaceae bacterium]
MSTGFRKVGLVEALDESRMENRRAATFQRRLGLESHEVTAEMLELFPFARWTDSSAASGCRTTAG